MFLYLLTTSLIFLPFILIYIHFKNEYSYWKIRNIDYLKPTFPFGNLTTIFSGKNGIGDCFKNLYSQSSDRFTGIYFIKSPAILVKDPELIKHIFVKDFNSFMDRGIYNNEKKEPASGHLFKLSGQRWRNLRNKLTPAFTAGKLKMMFETITDVALKLDESLQNNDTPYKIDVEDVTTRYSADIIASTIYGIEINSFVDKYNEFIVMAKDLFISTSYLRIFKATLQLFFPKIFKFFAIQSVKENQNKFINKLVRDVISHRENNHIERKDMMQLLIQLQNEGHIDPDDDNNEILNKNHKEINKNGFGISLDEVSAQAYTFFFAGYETTSSTMTFLLYECALNHQLQERIRKNIDDTLNKFQGCITYESISEMEVLHRAISETLRKYPILPFLVRKATKDYTLPGTNTIIEKGTRVLISISGLHYDPEHFPNPDEFDPDRFKHENLINRHPFSYLPFGEGPRNCIGKRMGKMMVAVGIATILRNYQVDVCEDTEVPLKYNKLAYFIKTIQPISLKITKILK